MKRQVLTGIAVLATLALCFSGYKWHAQRNAFEAIEALERSRTQFHVESAKSALRSARIADDRTYFALLHYYGATVLTLADNMQMDEHIRKEQSICKAEAKKLISALPWEPAQISDPSECDVIEAQVTREIERLP